MKIKTAAVAGQFYSSDKDELFANIESYVEGKKKDCEYESRAIIVPHAGYKYSGELAAKGYQYLDKNIEIIFIFAPAHRYAVESYALSSYTSFATPIGDVSVSKKYNDELKKSGGIVIDEAFTVEHSIEVQLPFIKYFFKKAKIVPVLIGGAGYQTIVDIIEKYWDNKKIGFVISSDLSHFRNKTEAKRIDNATADMIENNVYENILPEQACGYTAISAIVNFAKNKGFSLIRVGMTDSSEKTGETANVVGYGSWFLAEKEKCAFIVEYYSQFIKNIASISIQTILDKTNVQIDNYPRALETKIASFVTLKIGGNLRGCIGSINPFNPLIIDVCNNARNAAFNDSRFIPVEKKEFNSLEISVSILSKPERYQFKNENDLLNAITPETDGVIIKDAGRQALYLPEVWKSIPDKKEFLASLKQKAGLQADWFSNTFEAYRFTTSLID